ncbi:MAG: hypothetical protein WBG86_11295 [Polyangiales bacterium]
MVIAAILSLAASLTWAAAASPAMAQDLPSETIRATPKATIGLGLVGAELGLIIPAASGLTEIWALTVFPVVGATGGALVGYFTLDEPGREKGSVAALVVGLAGVLPAILVTIKGVREERENNWEPQTIEIRSEREQRAFELAEAGSGLFRRSRSGFRSGMPGLTLRRGAASSPETARHGQFRGQLRGRTEVGLSLASGVF